jgi:hypothetical protein
VGAGRGSTRGMRVDAGGGEFVHGVKAGVESGSARGASGAFVDASELMDADRAVPISSAMDGGSGVAGGLGDPRGGVLASSAIVGSSGAGPLEVGARVGAWGEEGRNRSGVVAAEGTGAAGGAGLGSSARRVMGEAVAGVAGELGDRGLIGEDVAGADVGRAAVAVAGAGLPGRAGSGLDSGRRVGLAAAGMDGNDGDREAPGAVVDAGAAARMEGSESVRGGLDGAAEMEVAAGIEGFDTDRGEPSTGGEAAGMDGAEGERGAAGTEGFETDRGAPSTGGEAAGIEGIDGDRGALGPVVAAGGAARIEGSETVRGAPV